MIFTFYTHSVLYQLFASNPMPPPIWPKIGALTFLFVVLIALLIKFLMIYPKRLEVEKTQAGINFIELKDYNNAIKCFDEAIRINSNYSEAYFNKARALIKIDDFNNALKTLEEFIKISKNSIDINVAKEIILSINNNIMKT